MLAPRVLGSFATEPDSATAMLAEMVLLGSLGVVAVAYACWTATATGRATRYSTPSRALRAVLLVAVGIVGSFQTLYALAVGMMIINGPSTG